ncbi:MAG TPA: Fur family transcriptional regulator [Stellaceae bacterium]
MANSVEKYQGFARAQHDHGHCVEDALDRAGAVCATQGARLTELRRAVLELVWRGNEPVGAYALLDALRDAHPGAAPPTVYRALEFLATHGLIHRIESLNAYIGCAHPERPHAGQFLICAKCSAAAEIDDPSIARALTKSANGLGFAVTHQTVELSGLCPRCQRVAMA